MFCRHLLLPVLQHPSPTPRSSDPGDIAFWNGHGTSRAGVALYCNLEATLTHGHPVELGHRIETVKILPPNGQNEPRLYGAITATGIARVEDKAPRRRRVFCMAVTSDVVLGRGRPSSWSSAKHGRPSCRERVCHNS